MSKYEIRRYAWTDDDQDHHIDELERAVIKAAEAWLDDYPEDMGMNHSQKVIADAVRALQEARDE